MTQLTEHFSLEELTASTLAVRYGIDNTPPAIALQAIKTAAEGMEKVRALLGKPIRVNSGYRCPALNTLVKGSPSSDHMLGYAVDFVCAEFGTPLQIAKAIAVSDIQYGQLIQEGTWVHISFNPNKKRDNLTAHFDNGKVTYTKGIA